MSHAIPRFKKKFNPKLHGVGLVVDCETTGLSPKKHAAVEIALIRFVYRRQPGKLQPILGTLGEYHGYRDPGSAAVNPIALRINRLCLAELRGQAWDDQRIQALITDVDAIISHNATFDRGFLEPLIPQLGTPAWHCSVRGVDWLQSGHPSRRLRELCEHYALPAPDHSALGDARALLHLLAVRLPSGRSVLGGLLRLE